MYYILNSRLKKSDQKSFLTPYTVPVYLDCAWAFHSIVFYNISISPTFQSGKIQIPVSEKSQFFLSAEDPWSAKNLIKGIASRDLYPPQRFVLVKINHA